MSHESVFLTQGPKEIAERGFLIRKQTMHAQKLDAVLQQLPYNAAADLVGPPPHHGQGAPNQPTCGQRVQLVRRRDERDVLAVRLLNHADIVHSEWYGRRKGLKQDNPYLSGSAPGC